MLDYANFGFYIADGRGESCGRFFYGIMEI